VRKLIPHALLALLTLGAGLGALTSFQSTRFSAARAALVAVPCTTEDTGQSIPVSNAPLEAIIPGSAVDNAGLYATPNASGLVAVAPSGWLCHVLAPNANASGIDIRNSQDPTSPVTVLQFTTAVGPSAEQVACPFSNKAKDQIFKIGGDMLVNSTCGMSEFVSISAQEDEYVFFTAKGDPSQPLYGVIAYSAITDSANVGICVPSDTLTPGKPSYVFDRSICKQYLRAFASNNPVK